MTKGLGLNAWWTEIAYKAASGSLSRKGAFILAKLREHDAAKFQIVIDDLNRDRQPDPADITKYEWQVILAYMDANEGEIKDVQLRMGRAWKSTESLSEDRA